MKAHRKFLGFLTALGLAALFACDDSATKEVPFEYKSILEQEFQDTGRSIPLTFEASVDVDGVFTADGLYFFYASDREAGNYDIYLRSLTSITTVRLTSHPSRDTMPAVSPDGDYLAFVSTREDPEGDIYVVRVKSKKLIKEAEESVTDLPPLDEDAKNLTQFQDPVSKTIKIIKDTTPAWSPDSTLVAFSSNRDGRENIWVMSRKGKDLTQITKDGGTSPRFSEDGKLIVFVSYRDAGGKGEIYTFNRETGEEKRVTNSPAIELSPTFLRTSDEIVFTRIDRDSNLDGQVNLKDDSVLMYHNLATGQEYPITLRSQSSFNPHWSSALNGVLVYSEQTGQNININVIPDTGIIPRKATASEQYELAAKFLDEYDDVERYLMCLEKTYHFFGKQGDVDSMVFTGKALADAAVKYAELKDQARAQQSLQTLIAFSADRSDYRSIMARCAVERMNRRGCADLLLGALGDVSADRTRESYLPYLMEDLADEYARQGRYNDSVLLYQRVIAEHASFIRLPYVHYKFAAATYTRLQDEVSPSYIQVFNSQKSLLVNDSINNLLAIFESERDVSRRAASAAAMLRKYGDVKLLASLLHYVAGKSLGEAGDAKSAKAEFLEALKSAQKTDLVYYKTNLALSEISEQEKDIEEFEEYLTEAITSYDLQWRQKDIRDVIQRLVDYYEDRGERAEFDRKYKRATAIYARYVKLVSYLQGKRRFSDIIAHSGARAHVLYIDAYVQWRGNTVEDLKKLEEKYTGKGLKRARRNFDKAYIYGLGYLYSRLAVAAEKEAASAAADIIGLPKQSITELLGYFKSAIEHLDWALFIDDSFTDAYILKGWVYQYVDLRRSEDQEETGGKNQKEFAEFFPRFLWEKNIALYERALVVNRESENPEQEGNLHLNIANTYFLLTNYERALQHYLLVAKYKSGFRSKIEEALYHYHYSYCCWQDAQYAKAREEMSKTLNIYQSLATGKKLKKYRKQILTAYYYFALLSRMEKKYADSIGWYNTILSFASRNKVKIDKARYMQEIAYCYGEMGDTAKSLQYLGKARVLLKKGTHEEKAYKMRWKILGLGPISFFDLGSDSVVIGGNRIYERLNTYEKKVLNFAMQEDIFFERGNFRKSIDILKKKLAQLEERSNKIDREAKIKTLNNIGYGYFKLRNYKQSLDYFKKAWDYAADSDVYDLEGIFESIINTANLYAFLIDENPGLLKNPVKEIDKLIGNITEYKDSYEEMRFAQELEVMKEDAKLRKKKVTPEQQQELRDQIREEATSIYYAIDIAVGVLTFYKAELIFSAEPPSLRGSSAEDRAYSFYLNNRDLFNMYAEALKRFETALSQAEKNGSNATIIKLLLNASACRQRMGMMDLAYESLAGAEKTARANAYEDLGWIVDHETARFLCRYGEAVEGKDAVVRAREYFRNAIAMVEGAPPLYSSYYNRIRRLYDEYADMLLAGGDWKTALVVLEKKYETLRTITLCLEAPQFRYAKDSEYFSAYMEKIYALNASGKQVSALLEAGEQPGSEKLKQFETLRTMQKADLAEFKTRLSAVSPLLASYLFGTGGSVEVPRGASVLKFIARGEKVFAWKLEAGASDFMDLAVTPGDPQSLASSVKKIIGAGPVRFIVLDAHSLAALDALREMGVPFTFVPSVERAKYYMDGDRGPFASAYYNATGIRKSLAGNDLTRKIIVSEGRLEETSLATFSIVVADDTSEVTVDPDLLFRERVSPALLVKEMAAIDPDAIGFFAEAALYSGSNSVVFCSNVKAQDFSLILQQAVQGTFDTLAQSPNIAKYRPVCMGFRGAEPAERIKSSGDVKEAAFKNYLAAFSAGNYKEATTDLQNWNELSAGDVESGIHRQILQAEIELAREQGMNALKLVDEAMGEAGEKYPQLYLRAAALKVYCLLRDGDIPGAKKLLGSIGDAGFASSSDYFTYYGIIALLESDRKSALDLFEQGRSAKTSFVSVLRQRFLAVEYLSLMGFENEAVKIASTLQPDFSLSQREICKLLIITGTENQALPSRRTGSILALRKETAADALKSSALLLVEENGEYDYLSAFPAGYAIDRMAKAQQFSVVTEIADGLDADDLVRDGFWMDAASLAAKVSQFYERQGNDADALEFRQKTEELIKAREVAPLKRQFYYDLASGLAKLGRHTEAYAAAEKGAAYFNPKDQARYIEYQILLMDEEVSLGKLGKAEERGIALGADMPDEYRYVRDLLQAKILFSRLNEKKTPADDEWKQLESLIAGALSVLDKSPGTLNRFDRLGLIRENLDYLILRRVNQGDNPGALLFAEIKKQLESRSALPAVVSGMPLPPEIAEEFKAIRDRAAGSVRFTELLRQYPALQVKALAGMIPLEQFQRTIPLNTIVLYVVRNQNDILIWAISGISVDALRIAGGYDRALKISERYKADLSSFNNIVSVSRDLSELLKPIEGYLNEKPAVVFITDRDMEDIPFEVMGDTDMLESTHAVCYLFSIIAGAGQFKPVEQTVSFIEAGRRTVYQELEGVALGQLGIPRKAENVPAAGIGHVLPSLVHSPESGDFLVEGRPFSSLIRGYGALYLSSADFTGNASYGEAALYASLLGVGTLVINDAEIHDVNGALFVDEFYTRYTSGLDIRSAFGDAKRALRSRIKYRYPAYWAGIRMYLNSL